jgi:uncharacterized Zn-binding protein involved in type VI secretion
MTAMTRIGGTMAGANTVFVNGLSAQKVGDPVSCGSTQASGSPDVYIGDGA